MTDTPTPITLGHEITRAEDGVHESAWSCSCGVVGVFFGSALIWTTPETHIADECRKAQDVLRHLLDLAQRWEATADPDLDIGYAYETCNAVLRLVREGDHE